MQKECCEQKGRLDGKTLIVQTVVGLAPYSLFSPADGRLCGLDVDIVKVLAEKLNFQLRMKFAKTWAKRHKNGSWDESMMGDVSTTYHFRFFMLQFLPK